MNALVHTSTIVCCDLDGTLVHDGGPPSPAVLDAVTRLTATTRIRVVLATSRSPRCVRPWFRPLLGRLDLLCCDGALWLQRGGVRWARPMDPALVARALDALDGVGADYAVDHGHSFATRTPTVMPWLGTEHRRVLPRHTPGAVAVDGRSPLHGVLRICVADGEAGARALTDLPGLTIFPHGSGDLDVVAAGTDKSRPLQMMRDVDHVRVPRLVVLGDDENDRGMLGLADRGYVVGGRMPDLDLLPGVVRVGTEDVVPVLEGLARESLVPARG